MNTVLIVNHCDLDQLEEENLIAAAKQIMMVLRSKKNLKNDTIKILADLSTQLIAITTIGENEDDEIDEIEGRLNVILEKVMSGETDQSMNRDSCRDEVTEYLKAADEARQLTERLDILCLNKGGGEKMRLRRAYNVLQMVMERLEELFKYMLDDIRQSFGPEISIGDESLEDSLNRDSIDMNSEEFISDLVQPVAISDLKRIANLMFNSGYSFECSQAYISVRRTALDECLSILERKLSIEDVHMSALERFESKIKRWIQNMKTFVRVFLASEKRLTEQIFGELGTVSVVCYAEASILKLLNLGKALSVGPCEPAQLFPILDMYKVLADLLPDIDSSCSDEAGSRVRMDWYEFLGMLAVSAREAFLAFVNDIITNRSTNPFPGGGIHHLTKHVMNYLRTVSGHCETYNNLFKDHDDEDLVFMSPAMSSTVEGDNISGGTCDFSPIAVHFRTDASIREWLSNGSPMSTALEEENRSGGTPGFPPTAIHFQSAASFLEEENRSGGTPGFPPTAIHFQSAASFLEWHYIGSTMHPDMEEENISGGACNFSLMTSHFQLVASILERNLNEMAKLYKEVSLQHLFLMNNIHYMTQMVKNSRLGPIFGDQWIRRHYMKFQQHAMNYERATWSSILDLLKYEDDFTSTFISITSRNKERLRSFNLAFEEVYRTQTAWLIPNAQLREELQISTSLKVIQAYWTFVGRNCYHNHIADKHIKYLPDDLENYLFDLFEGSPRSLQRRYRKHS